MNFLSYPLVFSRSFMSFQVLPVDVIDMYSDASRNFNLGFRAYCGPEWVFTQWDEEFMMKNEPSIEYLELFALVVGVLNWGKLFQNRRIILFVTMKQWSTW